MAIGPDAVDNNNDHVINRIDRYVTQQVSSGQYIRLPNGNIVVRLPQDMFDTLSNQAVFDSFKEMWTAMGWQDVKTISNARREGVELVFP